MRVRFAPTPGGPLFVGAARIAVANALFARRHGGEMLLRLDDLNPARCPPAAAEQIIQDLQWLGIGWDRCIRQSERAPLYEAAIALLKEQGRLYPCFESDEELRAKQEQRRKRGQPPLYDRAMLSLTPAQRAAAEAGGKRPYWRLRLSSRVLSWRDMILGDRQAKLPAISDPVLVRADGMPVAALASVVDDIDTGITHIIRSEDNAASTAIQIELFEILTGRPPGVRFAHIPALPETAGTRPGHRVGIQPLRALRADGVEPCALLACITGTEVAPAPDSVARDSVAPDAGARDTAHVLDMLARSVDPARIAASPFDAARLLAANRRALGGLDFAAVADRLPSGATERFWLAVRGSLDLLKEARGWWDVVAGTIVPPVIEGEHALLTAAAALLPPEPWDDTIWPRWVANVGEAAGRAEAGVALPLRLALTGEETGPDLGALLPLIGRARAGDRLRIAAA
ncbi:glutamate--tRNA ligase [Rhodopila sp.]|uniref:glutamate--tRNA ligase n=1 Tax=Rhodopila sp. TaxID=2480087 RepID=UPI002B6D01B1|nr:glutamate--tRNA ligase family protein [Rhodopila sp.]HVZ10163.1 glutamate--tRNA ligase family protein [Rhodopila sp.]